MYIFHLFVIIFNVLHQKSKGVLAKGEVSSWILNLFKIKFLSLRALGFLSWRPNPRKHQLNDKIQRFICLKKKAELKENN